MPLPRFPIGGAERIQYQLVHSSSEPEQQLPAKRGKIVPCQRLLPAKESRFTVLLLIRPGLTPTVIQPENGIPVGRGKPHRQQGADLRFHACFLPHLPDSGLLRHLALLQIAAGNQ